MKTSKQLKVKILNAAFPSSLESEVNSWLSHNFVEVVDIKYTSCGDSASSIYRFTAMIIYC